jgi:hypothetical protein
MKTPLLCASILAASLMLNTSTPVVQAQSPPAPMGRHTMEGEVTKVDAKRGWVDVKTAEGSMKLHFPSAVLASVKKGDRVSVEIGMTPGAPGAADTTTKTRTSKTTK